MKHYITPEEHARMQRRRGRQALGLLVAILVIVGFVTVLRAGVGAVANLFDDTAQKQEYEDKLEGLVLFDPMPFDGIENIDDLTLREAAVWGCIYNIQETQGGFDNYNTDPDTEQLLLPSLDVDAYLAKLLGPGFKLTHRSFEMEDMTIEFDDATQCYKIPVTARWATTAQSSPSCSSAAASACDRGLYPHHQHGRQHHQCFFGYAHQVHGLSVRAPERQLVSHRPDRERDQGREHGKHTGRECAGTHGRKRCAGCHSCSSRFGFCFG